MDINTTDITANPAAAAFPGARSAWAIVSGTGVNHALALNPVLAAVRPEPCDSAFRLIPAPTMPSGTRKQQTNVLKTRLSAGGYGAMGPHPEREPQPA
ncbi:MAG TPA: hypothetical protein VGD91_31375 [Trebonia sp.]